MKWKKTKDEKKPAAAAADATALEKQNKKLIKLTKEKKNWKRQNRNKGILGYINDSM